MTIVSMTGFAESHGAYGSLRWRWEIKSVNGRGLELRLRMPPGFESVEPAVRTLVNERFRRGSLQAVLTIEPSEEPRGLKIDPVALSAAVKIARELADETGLAPARVDGILALKGVMVQEDAQTLGPAERAGRDAAVVESLANALDSLKRARRTEGAKLASILNGLAGEIERLTGEAAKSASAQPEALRAKIANQIKELLGANAISEDRMAQETALLAMRADVREELDRLAAHVQEARVYLNSGEAVGRKLDFLAQEFNREANTLCSKSADIQLTKIGLALKAAIDQFREQTQNIE